MQGQTQEIQQVRICLSHWQTELPRADTERQNTNTKDKNKNTRNITCVCHEPIAGGSYSRWKDKIQIQRQIQIQKKKIQIQETQQVWADGNPKLLTLARRPGKGLSMIRKGPISLDVSAFFFVFFCPIS